jgi:hypothetical protein
MRNTQNPPAVLDVWLNHCSQRGKRNEDVHSRPRVFESTSTRRTNPIEPAETVTSTGCHSTKVREQELNVSETR